MRTVFFFRLSGGGTPFKGRHTQFKPSEELSYATHTETPETNLAVEATAFGFIIYYQPVQPDFCLNFFFPLSAAYAR